MTKKELEEIRDKLVVKHYDKYMNKEPYHMTYHYSEGFDAGADLLLPIIKEYEEALEKIANERKYFGTLPHIAREVLKKHRGDE